MSKRLRTDRSQKWHAENISNAKVSLLLLPNEKFFICIEKQKIGLNDKLLLVPYVFKSPLLIGANLKYLGRHVSYKVLLEHCYCHLILVRKDKVDILDQTHLHLHF